MASVRAPPTTGISELQKYVDSLITIPNQKLLTVLGSSTTLLDAFKAANQVLQGAVQGIAELITRPGLVNVDFADVRTVMSETGMAMMGNGSGRGEGRARAAAEAAVSSPLLEHVDLADAHGILVNVTAGMDMSIGEFQEVGNIVKEFASDEATIVMGTVIDPELQDEMRVTVVATGLNRVRSSRCVAVVAARPTSASASRCVRRRPAAKRRVVRSSVRRLRWLRLPPTTPVSTSLPCSVMPAPLAMALRPHRWMRICWISRLSCVARLTDRDGVHGNPAEDFRNAERLAVAARPRGRPCC